jgi:hypothetical protein
VKHQQTEAIREAACEAVDAWHDTAGRSRARQIALALYRALYAGEAAGDIDIEQVARLYGDADWRAAWSSDGVTAWRSLIAAIASVADGASDAARDIARARAAITVWHGTLRRYRRPTPASIAQLEDAYYAHITACPVVRSA